MRTDSVRQYYGDPRAAAPLPYGAKRNKLEHDRYYLSPRNRGAFHAMLDGQGRIEAADAIAFIDEHGEWL